MSISLKLVLILLLSVLTLYSVLTAPFSQNLEMISVDAAVDTQNFPLAITSSGFKQVGSTYPFPFMQGSVIETEDNNTSEAMPLAASNTSNTSNNWTVVTGMWRPTADGVQAGADYTKNPPGIVIRPLQFASSQLDIGTSFTINSLPPPPPPPASYIAIVYSWIDIKNFKYAGITLVNNQTYVHFTTTRNGETSVDTAWPGTRIDLEIKPGDPVRMILSLRENSETLNVNGIEVENDSVDNIASRYVGLFYSRVDDVLFHQFDIR